LKKILIGGLFFNLLFVFGCQSEKHHQLPVVEAEPKINEYDVSYNLDVDSEGNKVNVQITIENNKNQAIPLLTKKGHLFAIELKKKDGYLLEKKFIDQEDRRQILRQEVVTWNVDFEANMDEELVVESDLLLESDKYHQYHIENDVQTKNVIVSTQEIETPHLSFAPNNKMVYTYKTNNDTEIKEEFKFFNGNKVQSFSKEKGVQIYSQESDGIYYFSSPDPVGDIDGTEFIEKENMRLMIPFPIVEGRTWTVGDIQYKLSDQNIKVKTPLGLFDNCVEVTEIKGKVKRYYYYHKEIGLLKVKRAKSKGMPSATELQLTKIEDPAADKEKNKKKKK
jgi:hypothetical protein